VSKTFHWLLIHGLFQQQGVGLIQSYNITYDSFWGVWTTNGQQVESNCLDDLQGVARALSTSSSSAPGVSKHVAAAAS